MRIQPIILVLLLIFNAPIALGKPVKSRLNLDSTITQLSLIGDISLYKQVFKESYKLAPVDQKEDLKVIDKILLAVKYAALNDSINAQSNRLFAEAEKLASLQKDDALNIWVNSHIGFYYYSYSALIKAFPYYLKSARALQIIPYIDLIKANDVLKMNAYYYGNINDPKKAILFLETALQHTETDSPDHASFHFNLGQYYLAINDIPKAEAQQIRCQKSALRNNNIIYYAKALGELAKIEVTRKNYHLAEQLLIEDIALSEKAEDLRNTMYAQIQLGKVYILKKEYQKAKTYFDKAYTYASRKSYLYSYEKTIVENLLLLAKETNNSQAELAYYRKLEDLSVEAAATEGVEVTNKINWELQKQEIAAELEKEQIKSEKATLLKITWASISTIALLLTLIIIYAYKRKLKLQAQQLEAKILSYQMEKIQSENRLNETNNSLESFRLYLSEKNNQIEKLEAELININDSPSSSKVNNDSLEDLLEAHLLTEDNWLRFKKAFIAEQKPYYTYLMETFPGLTESNLRIILLQKLGLNNLQTANILGISTDAVKKAKQRLKKKYEDTFHNILQQIEIKNQAN